MSSSVGGRVTGLKANLGPNPATGFDNSLFGRVTLAPQIGGTWNTDYSINTFSVGNVSFVRAAPSGATTGLDVSSTWAPMYLLSFELVDGATPTTSTVNFNRMGMTENAVFVNFEAATNRLTVQDSPYNYSITAAAPPTGWAVTGNVSATDTQKGNTLNVAWTALPNTIGTNDLTPPIRYDLYRGTTSTFPLSDPLIPTGSRALASISPSASFTYSGGATSAKDGPDTGIPGAAPNNLSDGTQYWYTMRAKDSTLNPDSITVTPTAGQHKTINTDTQFVGPFTPHDYTAPSVPTGLVVARTDDQLLRITWGAPAENRDDLDVYLVFMKQDNSPAAPAGPTLVSAFDKRSNEPGDDYTVDTDYSGWTLVKKSADTFYENSTLVNGSNYWFKVFARDKEGTTSGAHEQGNNYSPAAFTYGAPGRAPSAVTNLVAGGSGSGKITLRWTNPTETYYGGSKVLITSDIASWGTAMSYGSDAADPVNVKLAVDKVAADPVPPVEEVVIDNMGGTPLTDGTVYYIGVFTYNKTPDPTTRSSESRSYIGTWPGGGGGGPVTYNFTKAASGLGLNSFAILQDVPLSVTVVLEGGAAGTPVAATTVADFVAALGGPANVATIGWLESDRMVGYYVTEVGGTATFTATEGAGLAAANTVNMSRGRAYQISVLRNMSVTISGR
ncbi:hypothetical protein HZC35_02930 [Candidatus Saganbacteria bacterium]|nr:hypothetical protein [Candidatus Saganbacteria bacterium]